MRVAYFVHDLNDPGVATRILMLRAAGLDVVATGFWRGSRPPHEIAGAPCVVLNRTYDSRLVHRALSVLRQAFGRQALRRRLGPADLYLARNLEMLAIAVVANRQNRPAVPIVYEVLDIHRLLLRRGPIGGLARRVERGLMRSVDLLATSSPAFLREYFEPVQFVHRRIAALVIENKRLRLDGDKSGASRPRRPTGPPWRIGWFGMLRCRRSLDILAVLAKRRPDLVRVEIFGRAAKPVARHIQRHLHANPALHFGGVYTRDELERLYASVHFTWAIDYFEENANSEWLLPNRIYEGGSCDIVPFALRRTETGRWLDQRSVGVLLDDPEAELEAFFDGLTPERYQLLKLAACAVPRSDVIAGRADCTHLAWILMTLVHRRQNAGSGEEAREAA